MFGFRFLLHVVGRLVNAPVEDEEDDESGPVVADDEGRIEDGVLEKLKTKQKKISQKKKMHQIQNNRVEIRPHIAWLLI